MQNKRKKFEGVVISKKMQKTAIVLVERFVKHPLVGKTYKMKKRFITHDENNLCKVGDKVKIMECRPISKTKKFTVIKNYSNHQSQGVNNDTETNTVHSSG